MDSYPKNLVDQYLKACNRLKKLERTVFKRFATTTKDALAVQEDFASLALRFEEAEIFQYAAMCHLGVAKCEVATCNVISECQSYLKAARNFARAYSAIESLHLRSNGGDEFKSGALRSYTQALERCPDDTVLKAAIIRELTILQPHYEGSTSSFASPAHCIYEMELTAHTCLQQRDFRAALQHLDDIVDNIAERKRESLYEDLMGRVEILRLLLLIMLNLPPTRQSPSHIKLIEFYYQMGNFVELSEARGAGNSSASRNCSSPCPGAYLPAALKETLGDIVVAWSERNEQMLQLLLRQLSGEFKSLNEAQRYVLHCICENIERNI